MMAGRRIEAMDRKKTILIVDDEIRNIRLLEAMLASENYILYSALNGEDALSIAVDQCPDLILLDIMMPGIDGFEVCRKLKQDEETRSIPVLIITALKSKENHIKGIEAGADDFLTKPVDVTELQIRVKSLLRIKSYHDELLTNYKDIAEKNKRLSRLERFKDGLMHMIVHDLNNPLQAISISLQMFLMDRENLSRKQTERLEKCIELCSDLGALIQGILDINRMEEERLEPVKTLTDLGKLTNDVLTQFQERIHARHISLSFRRPEDRGLVEIDPGLTKRVIANLIDNAIRHTPEGGEIDVQIDYREDEKNMYFSIRDNGDGIAPAYQRYIFDKFRQAEIRQAGVTTGKSGLGLTFCKMAVEAQMGDIWVKSDGQGAGTTFGFTIPYRSNVG